MSAAALLSAALIMSACGSARDVPPAPVEEVAPAGVPAGITPLTLEQEEDSSG